MVNSFNLINNFVHNTTSPGQSIISEIGIHNPILATITDGKTDGSPVEEQNLSLLYTELQEHKKNLDQILDTGSYSKEGQTITIDSNSPSYARLVQLRQEFEDITQQLAENFTEIQSGTQDVILNKHYTDHSKDVSNHKKHSLPHQALSFAAKTGIQFAVNSGLNQANIPTAVSRPIAEGTGTTAQQLFDKQAMTPITNLGNAALHHAGELTQQALDATGIENPILTGMVGNTVTTTAAQIATGQQVTPLKNATNSVITTASNLISQNISQVSPDPEINSRIQTGISYALEEPNIRKIPEKFVQGALASTPYTLLNAVDPNSPQDIIENFGNNTARIAGQMTTKIVSNTTTPFTDSNILTNSFAPPIQELSRTAANLVKNTISQPTNVSQHVNHAVGDIATTLNPTNLAQTVGNRLITNTAQTTYETAQDLAYTNLPINPQDPGVQHVAQVAHKTVTTTAQTVKTGLKKLLTSNPKPTPSQNPSTPSNIDNAQQVQPIENNAVEAFTKRTIMRTEKSEFSAEALTRRRSTITTTEASSQ